MTKRNFLKGSLREMVYNYGKKKKTFTLLELEKKFPDENRNSLRGILSTFKLAGIVTNDIVWSFND